MDMINDGLIPFSPNQQNAIWMLVNAEYYRDAINLKIKDLTMSSYGIFVNDNQLFSSEELLYLIKLVQQPSTKHSHLNLDFDEDGNLIHYINNYNVEVLFNALQVKFIKLLCLYFNN